MMGARFEISEFNINFDFKDRGHIELLKKQIQTSAKLGVECYEEDGVYKIIDGGHAYVALQELGLDPMEYARISILKFDGDADKLAYSRHKNINRLQQTPVTYTKSIFAELKLRLGVTTDEEVKKILRRLYNLKYYAEKLQLKENEHDATYKNVLIGVFQNETKSCEAFTTDNLDYLDFPLWLAEMVDRGELFVAQATILNKKSLVEKLSEEMRRKIADLVKGKSVRDTEKGVDELLRFEPPIYNVWNFAGCSPLFGIEYPGRIPGQIVQLNGMVVE